jgi:DNA-binding NarL/FixJ family response regulator
MTARLRVVLADDHHLFRQGLAALIATVDGIEVVAEAGDGEAAVQAVARERPDVALIDLQMPGGGGINAIRDITNRFPDVATLVLTMFEDDDSLYGAMSAGARGYVLKDADDEELIRAVFTVGNGGVTYGAAVAQRIAATLASTRRRVEPSAAFPTLTASELAVLEQLAEGHRNDVIAANLGYSPKTVRNYVSIILAKLCVEDRSQAIVAARQAGAHLRP